MAVASLKISLAKVVLIIIAFRKTDTERLVQDPVRYNNLKMIGLI